MLEAMDDTSSTFFMDFFNEAFNPTLAATMQALLRLRSLRSLRCHAGSGKRGVVAHPRPRSLEILSKEADSPNDLNALIEIRQLPTPQKQCQTIDGRTRDDRHQVWPKNRTNNNTTKNEPTKRTKTTSPKQRTKQTEPNKAPK